MNDPLSATDLQPPELRPIGLPRQELEELFAGLGEKPFRARQLMRWMYGRGVLDPAAMTGSVVAKGKDSIGGTRVQAKMKFSVLEQVDPPGSAIPISSPATCSRARST